MLTRLSRLIAAFVVVFPLCASAQWSPSGNDIVSSCPTAPCKVVVNPTTPTTSAVGLDISGSMVMRGAGPFILLSGSSAATGVAVDALTSQIAQIMLRSGGTESVFLRREPTTNDFTIFTTTAERMRVTAAGRVGIGTASPTAQFSVLGAGDVAQLRIGMSANGGGIAAHILNADAMSIGLGADLTNGAWNAQDATAAWISKNTGKFIIYGSSGNTPNTPVLGIHEMVSVDIASGNVGINVPNPTARLHVGGNIVATGSITGATVIGAVYQDVAEWVPSSDDLAPGTVVILDKRHGNTVTASHKAYDTLVAGVVSAQPGIILGEGSATKEQIATTGRVRVRVDASAQAVEIGDLLVTSDVSGTAMKSAPIDIGGVAIHRPGTIIGKALEPLAAGVGEILVLLSLQ